ncbi:MAG: hypothetical protein K2K69_02880, partial [Muribaculaceae bacterium]|nr:hypothetical protein [Muribaculaceae bacterium]
MELFGLSQGPEVGYFAKNLKQAIKDCEIEDTREAAYAYLLNLAAAKGLTPVKELDINTYEPEKENDNP